MDNNSVSTPKKLLQHGYDYIKLIGEGSNGKTYKARNLKTGEVVAVKALKFSDNLKNYELFEREAEALKSIQTPGVPRFYEYITGEGEFTECWLVQEYIESESILDKLERGEKFDEIQTLETIFHVAEIVYELQTSYAQPIIHRDIKPSNILVRTTPQGSTKLSLIDFGAVANPQKRGLNSTVAGTVGYMAPEQLVGDCTIQSDYYALGATALHMMTGINPSEFPSDGFVIQFDKQLIESVPSVHQETIELLHKMLAVNPSDRPKDAKTLLQSVSHVLVNINASAIAKRKKMEWKLSIANKKWISPVGICLVMGLALIWKLHVFGDPIDFIALLAAPIFIAVIVISMWKDLDKAIAKLPNYDIDKTVIEKFAENDVEKLDLSKSHEAAGEITCIHRDIVEYVVNIGHKYYTAFSRVKTETHYEVGDKITVKYVKRDDFAEPFEEYRFYDISPLLGD